MKGEPLDLVQLGDIAIRQAGLSGFDISNQIGRYTRIRALGIIWDQEAAVGIVFETGLRFHGLTLTAGMMVNVKFLTPASLNRGLYALTKSMLFVYHSTPSRQCRSYFKA